MCLQAIQGIFEAGSQLLETKRLLHESLIKNGRLLELKKMALTRIQAAESNHKSAEARLMIAERQVRELTAKFDLKFGCVYELRVANEKLQTELNEARAKVKKAEDEAQSYYDQGFEEAAESLKSQLAQECNKSLKSQLAQECNKCFLRGWNSTLDQVGVNNTSELYNLGRKHLPCKVGSSKEHEEEATEGSRDPEPLNIEDVQEGGDGAEKDNNVEIV